MDAAQLVAFLILCAIPCGVWIWCTYRQRSSDIDNHIDGALRLANGLDEFDEDGTDLEMERRTGRHRKECGQQ